MKILIAADGHGAEIYIGALATGFKKLGHAVSLFTWKEYFHHYPYADVYPTRRNPLASVYYRFQNKFTVGPAVKKLNADLLAQAQREKPALIFIYRGTHVYPRTIAALKKTGAKVFGYNNDDPFSPLYPAYFWRHFRRAIPLYHHLFAYRQKNLAEYRARGAKQVSLLRSYYVAKNNFPIAKPGKNRFTADVIFVGHYEPDGRDNTLKYLLDNGINLKIFGTNWQRSPHYACFVAKLGPIRPAYKTDYNLALNSAKIALSFLSALNNDTYTRRSFEIPAAGTLMLSQYTDDLAGNLFKPNVEAVYFRTPEELLKQVKKLLANPARRKKIAAAGRARLLRSGHEATDRCREILSCL